MHRSFDPMNFFAPGAATPLNTNMGQPQQQQFTQPQGQNPQGQQAMQVQNGGQPQQQQMPNPVANIMATASQQNNPGGTSPTQGAQNNLTEQNPLDSFASMFTIPDTQGKTAPEALDAPFFSGNQADITKALESHNFVPQLDPQLMQQALGGDQQAFQKVLNSVAGNVMQQSIALMQNMVQQSLGVYTNRLNSHLPNKFKDFSAKEALATIPGAQHKAVNPLIQALTQQAMQANPQLSAAEAAKQAQAYMEAVAKQFMPKIAPVNPINGQPLAQTNQAETDWSSVFG